MPETKRGILVLENGSKFTGQWLDAAPSCFGEVVFQTAMTGYEETLTDPSYGGQIVVMTYPSIGNTGINRLDHQSKRPALSGFVIDELCCSPSHYQSQSSLEDFLREYAIPTLYGVDTRKLVHIIRQHGTLRAWMGPESQIDECPEHADDFPSLAPDLVARASVKSPYQLGQTGPRIVLYDLGCKQGIIDHLLQAPCRLTVVPWNTPSSTVENWQPDGIVFSNGPGDPRHLHTILPTVRRLSSNYPTLGICLGHQLLAMAHGATIGRLPFGHHGANHPVRELESGRIWITSQNHNFTVLKDRLPSNLVISHQHVNDGSIEGLKYLNLPIQSTQFHPEGCPGPNDSLDIIRRFVAALRTEGDEKLAHAT